MLNFARKGGSIALVASSGTLEIGSGRPLSGGDGGDIPAFA
jgi:hypothetical protein